MVKKFEETLESNKKLVDTLRFFIEDQAFKVEFLVTTVLEYIENNMEENKKENKK